MSSLLQPLQRDDLRLHSKRLDSGNCSNKYEAVKKPPQTETFWMDENFSSCMPMHQTTDAEHKMVTERANSVPIEVVFSDQKRWTDGLLLAQRI
jgi:hypothetical protein